MTSTVDLDRAAGLVVLAYHGDVTVADLQQATSAAIALGRAAGVNHFLIDAREMLFALSLSALYDLPADQYVREGADRLSRIALVVPRDPRSREAARFYEMVCVNRGWRVQLFDACEPARVWLGDATAAD